jgi:hypothetical protein
LNTGRAIAPHLQRGALVVLESTTYPGTTDEDLRAVLEDGSGLQAGVDFYLAFSPEREDPGNLASRVADVPKVVGGYSPACLARATALYKHAVKSVVPVSSCRAAEATKHRLPTSHVITGRLLRAAFYANSIVPKTSSVLTLQEWEREIKVPASLSSRVQRKGILLADADAGIS